MTGNQAMQQVKAGLKAIYLSGWQVAADANIAGEMYPDQSLYPVNSVPNVVKRINNTFARADQIQHMEGSDTIDFFAPIVADAEAGFGGVLNAFELMKAMIEAGAAGVHFEDQLASVKKCGHMGGKVLVPTREAVDKLVAARLAADSMGVPTIILARTDAEAADLVTSDIDENDRPFLTGERTIEGFYKTRNGLDQAVSRGLAYAPYADLIWCETGKPDLAFAKAFADAIHAKFPGKMLAYNCSPSFNWKKNLDDATVAKFQRELGAMGYKFQFITLAGFHSLNYSMFNLAHGYAHEHMTAFVELQEAEFAAMSKGFTAIKHQREVGTSYFDAITTTIQGSQASTTALKNSTEDEQFFEKPKDRAARSPTADGSGASAATSGSARRRAERTARAALSSGPTLPARGLSAHDRARRAEPSDVPAVRYAWTTSPEELAAPAAPMPTPIVRAFFALVPDDDVRRQISALARDVARRSRGRAVSGDHVHLTLAFIGDVATDVHPRAAGDRRRASARRCDARVRHARRVAGVRRRVDRAAGDPGAAATHVCRAARRARARRISGRRAPVPPARHAGAALRAAAAARGMPADPLARGPALPDGVAAAAGRAGLHRTRGWPLTVVISGA